MPPEGWFPVSYTHLDVYKRQGRCRTGDAETAYPEYPAPEKSPGICWYCAISGDQYEERKIFPKMYLSV